SRAGQSHKDYTVHGASYRVKFSTFLGYGSSSRLPVPAYSASWIITRSSAWISRMTCQSRHLMRGAVFDFDGSITQGYLTSRTAQRLIRELGSQQREELEQNWPSAREGKALYRIAPLR